MLRRFHCLSKMSPLFHLEFMVPSSSYIFTYFIHNYFCPHKPFFIQFYLSTYVYFHLYLYFYFLVNTFYSLSTLFLLLQFFSCPKGPLNSSFLYKTLSGCGSLFLSSKIRLCCLELIHLWVEQKGSVHLLNDHSFPWILLGVLYNMSHLIHMATGE